MNQFSKGTDMEQQQKVNLYNSESMENARKGVMWPKAIME
jgi:hypothetical protein